MIQAALEEYSAVLTVQNSCTAVSDTDATVHSILMQQCCTATGLQQYHAYCTAWYMTVLSYANETVHYLLMHLLEFGALRLSPTGHRHRLVPPQARHTRSPRQDLQAPGGRSTAKRRGERQDEDVKVGQPGGA